MKVFESGQDWKIAALRNHFHVHFLFGDYMKKKYFDIVYEQANRAFNAGEIPVGCIIVKNNVVIARSHNKREKMNYVLGHAELLALQDASKLLGNWRLEGCDVYISLDPCPMCAAALAQARVRGIYCAVSSTNNDEKAIVNKIIPKKTKFLSDLDVERSSTLLKNFFKNKR